MSSSEARRWKNSDCECGWGHESRRCKTQTGPGCDVDPALHRVDLSGTRAGQENPYEGGAVMLQNFILAQAAEPLAVLLLGF